MGLSSEQLLQLFAMKVENRNHCQSFHVYCPTPQLLDKGTKRSVKYKYLIIHKPSRPVMFSLRCEQLATKFRPDVALKMSTDL